MPIGTRTSMPIDTCWLSGTTACWSPMKTDAVVEQFGKWIITGHPGLRGLTFTDRKHAEAFLARVTRLETDLEKALRSAILATK